MYIFLILIHVFVCLVLIIVVLLQAGRGGGLSDMMGGGQPQSVFGTQTNQFMTRATEVCAVVFVITSLSLGIISTQRGKSLMEKRHLGNALKTAIPGVPTAKPVTQAAPVTTPSPAAPVAAAATPAAAPVTEEKPAS